MNNIIDRILNVFDTTAEAVRKFDRKVAFARESMAFYDAQQMFSNDHPTWEYHYG